MSFSEIMLTAFALSMDAFAASITAGLALSKTTIKKSAIIAFYFGFFQALMPIIGFFLAVSFKEKIEQYDHWFAFVLLVIIGAKMIFDSFCDEDDLACLSDMEILNPSKILPIAVATSIDALAVGVTLAFLKVDILYSASTIGITTFTLSLIGVKIGSFIGSKFKAKATFVGGIILIIIGIKILVEHL